MQQRTSNFTIYFALSLAVFAAVASTPERGPPAGEKFAQVLQLVMQAVAGMPIAGEGPDLFVAETEHKPVRF